MIEDKREIYILYIRSILEQACVSWHISFSEDDALDLEKVQRAAIGLILGENYKNYEDGLLWGNLELLKKKRKTLQDIYKQMYEEWESKKR